MLGRNSSRGRDHGCFVVSTTLHDIVAGEEICGHNHEVLWSQPWISMVATINF